MIQCSKAQCVQVVFLDDTTDDFFYHHKMSNTICQEIAAKAELPVRVEFNFLRHAELTDEGEFISGGEILESYEDVITTEDE